MDVPVPQGVDSRSNEDDPAGTCFETIRETEVSATSGRSRTSRILKTTQQVANTKDQLKILSQERIQQRTVELAVEL